jgi:hypothetical protein
MTSKHKWSPRQGNGNGIGEVEDRRIGKDGRKTAE